MLKFWGADYTTLRRDRQTRGGVVFICVKNDITCTELWVDEVYETTAVELKWRYPKITWEIVNIYRAPKEDIRVLEKLAERTGYTGCFTT